MLFITFEGVDGSGKTTQATLLAERLKSRGFEVLQLREPGGTEVGEAIRDILLDPAMSIEPMAEMLLFSAARAQLVASVIRPALVKGTVVLCDRFFDSTTVYQGFARELGELPWMADFHRRVTGGLLPHRTYLVDVSASVAASRRNARGNEEAEDRMEAAGSAFLNRVVAGYREIAMAEPERFRTIDGSRDVDTIAAEIWDDVSVLLDGGTAP
jgi:dTMP kinase